MMTPTLVCCVVLLTYSICLACDTKAVLPNAGHLFDWITSSSSDTSGLMPGAADDATVYYNNGLKRSFHWHMSITEDGHFLHDDEDPNEVIAESYDESGKINEDSAEESLDMKDSIHTYLGDDSKHYVAYVRCSENGWVIWIYTSTKMVSTELLVYIHNDLLRHGVSAPLRLSRCIDMKDI